jgi:hypothetical protein
MERPAPLDKTTALPIIPPDMVTRLYFRDFDRALMPTIFIL